MAMPKALTQFTSPILDKALETGARGETTTQTNYGVIGDAFFKKAQLDHNIANLQADMGIKKATLLSNIEMQGAELQLNKANVLLDYSIKKGALDLDMEKFAWEKKKYKKENEVSDMEKIMGVIQGAADGYVTGKNLGDGSNRNGTIGAILGGIATYGAYEQDGRRGGTNVRSMIGNISQAAQVYKQIGDKKKAEEAMDGVLKSAQNDYNTSQNHPDPVERQAATERYQAGLSKMNSLGVESGMNLQESMKMTGEFKDMIGAGAPKNQMEWRSRGEAKTAQILAEARANPALQDPNSPGYIQARNDLRNAVMQSNASTYGAGATNNKTLFASQMESVRPGLYREMSGARNGGAGGTVSSGGSSSLGTMPSKKSSAPTDGTVENIGNKSRAIEQQPAPFSQGGVPYRMSGATIDAPNALTNQAPAAPTEQDLLKTGTASANAISESNSDAQNASALKNKFNEWTNPGTETKKSVSADNLGDYKTKPDDPRINPQFKSDKEAVYRTSTNSLEIMDKLGVNPNSYDQGTSKSIKDNIKATTRINNLKETYKRAGRHNYNDKQMEVIERYIHGKGEEAIQGAGGGVAGFNAHYFRRDMQLAHDGKGGTGRAKEGQVSEEMLRDAEAYVRQQMGLAGLVAKSINGEAGALSEGDTQRAMIQLGNTRSSDILGNLEAVEEVSLTLWNNFQIDVYGGPKPPKTSTKAPSYDQLLF